MDKFVQKWRKKSDIVPNKQTPPKDNALSDAEISPSVEVPSQSESMPNKESNNQSVDKSIVSNCSSIQQIKKSQSARTYQPHWLNTFPWIRYDDTSKKVFCAICVEGYTKLKINASASYEKFDKFSYQSYVAEGFSNWRNAITRFKSHEVSQFHRKAVCAVVSKNQGVNVSNSISKQNAEARKNARFCLMKIVETVRFLATQGISIRGHSEDNSNFIQLLKLRAKDIPLLKSWLERSTYKWISHDIINEILCLLSHTVLKKLLEKVTIPPFYAVMADETTDLSHREQMSINFRVVDECLNIDEHFLGFYETPFTDSETLFAVMRDVLLRFNLPFSRCRGQCYDGASCVSGCITGLQTRFRQEEPRALYTHCAGHNLNLVAQDGMKKIQLIANFLSEMKELVTFVRASAKRFEIFKQMHLIDDDDEEDDDSEDIANEKSDNDDGRRTTNLKSFCMTRWCVRVKSLKSIKANYKEVLKFCDKVGKENTDAGIKARGFAHKLNKFETLLYLNMCIQTLEKVEALNETLQATGITFKSVIRRVELLKTSMQSMRNSKTFEDLWTETQNQATQLDLDEKEPFLPRQRKVPRKFDDNPSTAYFPSSPKEQHRPTFFAIIDQIMSSLNTRFDSETYDILSKFEDFALKKCEFADIEQYLRYNDECDFNEDRLVLHRNMFFDVVKERKLKIDDLTSITKFLQANAVEREMFSEYTKFIRLLLTYPQTVCIAERSFSHLRRLKSYLRTTMTQLRTNEIALLYIHQEIANEINLEELLDEFISRNKHRQNAFALSTSCV